MGRWTLRVLGCGLVLAGLTGPAHATTVLRAPLSELAANSDVIVHGWVRFIDDHLAVGPDGPFETAIDLEVREVLKGLAPQTTTLRVVLPGGRAFGRTMKIPGMPAFRVGQEVVLLLERHPGGFALTGLAQGVFSIRRGGSIPTAERDLRGLDFLGPDVGGGDLPHRAPELDQLLADLRRWGASPAEQGATP